MVKNDTGLAGASQQNERTYAPITKNKLCFKEANQIQGSTNQTKNQTNHNFFHIRPPYFIMLLNAK